MNKKDLIREITAETGLTQKQANDALNAALNAMKQALRRDERVRLNGFGTFELRLRRARAARNPRTGEKVQTAPMKTVVFRAGQELQMNTEESSCD